MKTLRDKPHILFLLIRSILIEIRSRIWMQFFLRSYSQTGEDLVIDKLTKRKKGFYVDVGAYNPNRFSNTKRFYLLGWTGINIEPDSHNYHKFERHRHRDINLNIGIANTDSYATFYKFSPSTLSTFSCQEAQKYKQFGYKLIGKEVLQVRRLATIFKQHCVNLTIDFLSIDTEGYDYEVLKSNDWKKYKPKVICIESAAFTGSWQTELLAPMFDRSHRYLLRLGYKNVYRNKINSIYQLTDI